MKRGRGKCVGREDRVKGLGGDNILCVNDGQKTLQHFRNKINRDEDINLSS